MTTERPDLPFESQQFVDEECGAGHVCCDIPDGPPLHDHFLERDVCPACQKIDARDEVPDDH